MKSFLRYSVNHFIKILPPTRFFSFKAFLWRLCGVNVHKTARLVSSVQIWTSGQVIIGPGSNLGHDTKILGGDAAVTIGEEANISSDVLLITGTHDIDPADDAPSAGKGRSEPITIEKGVWIGARVTVLGGVTVGEKAIVGAGSLVKKSVPARAVVAGVPATVKKTIDDD